MKRRKYTKTTPSVKANQRAHRGESFHPWRNQNCRTKKITFPTLEEAHNYLKHQDKELVAYVCPHCSGIHLGTPMAFNFFGGAVIYLKNGDKNPADYDIYQCQSKAPCSGKWHYRLKPAV